MKLYGFGLYHDPDHDYHHGHAHFGASELSGLVWLPPTPLTFTYIHSILAAQSSSLVECTGLFIAVHLKCPPTPCKTEYSELLQFKAGAMLGDAYLHQLPHAFWG
ncbi:hypothetical protein L6164_001361 [Bauhinia variegata]|uniref:Uncharacterized protein n=1 Tax=Bauhinia variegata TaxID=167791 RepID=A0ACB9Q994_BAUVA|nr:hypothetical protein L6164_001361 [Bauhinia variegata]